MTKFGLSAIAFNIRDFIEQAVVAEASGFNSIWISDHFTDLPPSNDKYEPWTVLAAIGERTDDLLLGTLATDCIRRHPASIAHASVTLDNLTRGRVILGTGAGEAMNIRAYGFPWESVEKRLARLEESVRLIRQLWNSSIDDPVDFVGQFYNLKDARLDLSPYQSREIPIYIAALGSNRALKLTGELGDGWLPWFNTPNSFVERSRLIDDAARNIDRDPQRIEKTAVVYLALTNDEAKRKTILSSMKAEIAVLNAPGRIAKEGFILNSSAATNCSYQTSLASLSDAEHAKQYC